MQKVLTRRQISRWWIIMMDRGYILLGGEQVEWAIQLPRARARYKLPHWVPHCHTGAPRAEHTRTHCPGNLSILPYLPAPARKWDESSHPSEVFTNQKCPPWKFLSSSKNRETSLPNSIFQPEDQVITFFLFGIPGLPCSPIIGPYRKTEEISLSWPVHLPDSSVPITGTNFIPAYLLPKH